MSKEFLESDSTPKNRLAALEGGNSFAGYLMNANMPESMSESRKQRIVAKYNTLANVYNHYAQEWATQEGKSGQLTDDETAERTKYISNISPDQIIALLQGWQKDWGESEYAKKGEDDKTAIDAADDLISEIGTW